MAEALRDRKQQVAQEQNERDVNAAQYVRRHDAVCGIQVEQRHDHRKRGGEHSKRARQLVDRAFFGFDVLLGLFQRLFSDDRLFPPLRPIVVAHDALTFFPTLR